jgi:cell division transport system permease protein
MRGIQYALRQGWISLWRTRSASVFAIAAIALALVVLGSLLLLSFNVELLLSRWTNAAEFSVFLKDDATSEQRAAIEGAIAQSGAARGREYVSKDQALTRFKREFAELATLTSGFDDNPFPASIEVQVDPAAERDRRADALVKQVAALPGVADVRYDREWLERFGAGLQTARGAGFAIVMLMALAAAVTVAAVVRLGLDARRDEIEIMALVGAPMTFIRGPFVGEGVLQGGIGAGLALLLLWLGFSAAQGWWGTELRGLLDGAAVAFLPARMCAYLILGGMLVGAAGGFAAARHAG